MKTNDNIARDDFGMYAYRGPRACPGLTGSNTLRDDDAYNKHGDDPGFSDGSPAHMRLRLERLQ